MGGEWYHFQSLREGEMTLPIFLVRRHILLLIHGVGSFHVCLFGGNSKRMATDTVKEGGFRSFQY